MATTRAGRAGTGSILALVLGSIAGFAALRRYHGIPVVSLVFSALWTVGMLVVILFPKHDLATGHLAARVTAAAG